MSNEKGEEQPNGADNGADMGFKKLDAQPAGADHNKGEGSKKLDALPAGADPNEGEGSKKLNAQPAGADHNKGEGSKKLDAQSAGADHNKGEGSKKLDAQPAGADHNKGEGSKKLDALPAGTDPNDGEGSKKLDALPAGADPNDGELSGLHMLIPINGLMVNQRIEVLEIITGIDTSNKYDIYALGGGLLFYAYETSSCIGRLCMRRRRVFTMHIIDITGREIIRVHRKFKCCFCFGDNFSKLCACCCCCREAIYVEAPPGRRIGYIHQTCGTKLNFALNDERNSRIASVTGPSCCGCGCCTCCFPNKIFKIYSNNGERIGAITKKFSGFVKEVFTNADNFEVEFPVDMSVQGKALILSTVFLIDFIAFEEKTDKRTMIS